MAYDLGSVIPLGVTVKDASDTLVNAGAMSLTVTLPDDTTLSVSPVTPVSTGTYTYDYVTVQSGRHLVRWVATGANANAYTDVFDVREQVPVSIVSLADAKHQLNIDASDTSDDVELRGFITGASLAVERELGTIVARRTFTERRTANGGRLLLSNVPVLSLTTAASPDGSTTWPVEDLDFDAATGLVAAASSTPLSADVDMTYTAGLRIVPEDYQLATLIVIQHLWETQRGTMGAVPGGGQEPEYMSGRGFALPRRALELLGTTIPGIA